MKQLLWRLMRIDKPVGILLLWAPTAWALWLGSKGSPSMMWVMYFLLGTFCMRSAGCVINDLADRHIDKHVARTRERPLTTGQLSLSAALGCLAVLLGLALWIVWQLPTTCLVAAGGAVLITGIYPLMKRCFKAPQLVLGLAFSMGIPMVYLALQRPFDRLFWQLCLLNTLWILAYDTMYAMVDRADDVRIGVESTARLFGRFVPQVLGVLQVMVQGIWIWIAWSQQVALEFYFAWLVGSGLFLYQQWMMARDDYFRAFMNNAWYGLVMWSGCMVAM